MRSFCKTDSSILGFLRSVKCLLAQCHSKKCRQMPHSLWLQQCSQAKYHQDLLHCQIPLPSAPGPSPSSGTLSISRYLLHHHRVPSPSPGTLSITRYLLHHHQVPSPSSPGTFSITRYLFHHHQVPSPSPGTFSIIRYLPLPVLLLYRHAQRKGALESHCCLLPFN